MPRAPAGYQPVGPNPQHSPTCHLPALSDGGPESVEPHWDHPAPSTAHPTSTAYVTRRGREGPGIPYQGPRHSYSTAPHISQNTGHQIGRRASRPTGRPPADFSGRPNTRAGQDRKHRARKIRSRRGQTTSTNIQFAIPRLLSRTPLWCNSLHDLPPNKGINTQRVFHRVYSTHTGIGPRIFRSWVFPVPHRFFSPVFTRLLDYTPAPP